MAHLTYALNEGDGFAKITGEIGTGKTTLCRAFLENLDESAEVAYIFNPKLNSLQLLKTINAEFGIFSNADNSKDLIDALNAFLISKKSKGEKVLLLIDEAQNLSKAVLEQIRLISNLETTQSKLLQIILVGQLELDYMLNSPDLRQLGQRISLSCQLVPLTYEETRDYIQYRINIAAHKPNSIFSKEAIREIYKYSKGIPRLINIACDRMLLSAYAMNRYQVTGKTAKDSIKELKNKDYTRAYQFLGWKIPALLFSILIAIFITIRIFDTTDISKLSKDQPLQPKKSNSSIVTSTYTLSQESNPIQELNMLESDDMEDLVESKEIHINTSASSRRNQNASQETTFSVQVGAFRLKQNAEERQAYLENKGYSARLIILTDFKKRVWYTVRIGTYENRDEASRFAKEFSLKEKFVASVRPNNAI